MENTLSEALLVSTSWNTASDDLTSPPTRTLVKYFCEKTLKSDEVSKLYCTVLDVEVSKDHKKDAESVGVTLIPAVRCKWSDPLEDPPATTWLLHHEKYYKGLEKFQHVKHVINFSPKTKNAAAAIHESLFPKAQLHQLTLPTPPGVVVAFDAWSRHACGLTGYHRAIIQDFLTRKAGSGEYLKAYSTVVDVELSEDQIEDAEKCGVTLIKAERKKGVDEMPKVAWLVNHESYFPDLGKLENIKYVVGYSPKTGLAAIDIRKKLFPAAKLVLINHACQEENCLLVKDEFSDFEQEMLEMASHADLLFSIGPCIYDYFQRAYRTEIGGRKLYDIPHKEILPKPRQQYFDNERPETDIEIDGHSILTYGQLNTEEALKRCDSIAASIGSAANKYHDVGKKTLEWKIHGVCEHAYKATKNFLVENLQSSHATPKPYKQYSAESLSQSLQQSDLCLPPSCYTDYSFEGLEAMAAGLPTTVQDDSHIAGMIDRHFEDHKDYCVVGNETKQMTLKIITNLKKTNVALQQAKLLKEALTESEAVTESLAIFASSLTDENGETKFSETNGKNEMKEKRKEKEMALINESAMMITEDFNTGEDNELLSDTSVNFEKDRKESKAVQQKMSVKEALATMQTTAEEVDAPDTQAVQAESAATEGKETYTETIAVQPETAVKEDTDTTEMKAVPPGISTAPEVKKTTDTTAELKDSKESPATIHPWMSCTEDMETTESTAMQSGISATESEDRTKPMMRMQHEKIETDEETDKSNITHAHITEDENNDRTSQTVAISGHRYSTKTKDRNNDTKQTLPKMLKKKDRMSRKRKSSGFERSGQKENEAVAPKIQRMGSVSRNPGTPPPSPQSIATGSGNDSSDFMVCIELNEESYIQQMRDLDNQRQTRSVKEKKKKLKAAWEKCKAQHDETTNEVITNEESQQRVDYNCRKHFGNVKSKGNKKCSLAIHLDIPTMYNLYRLEHTCLSGSFPDSFEPLLITDKMREEADKVGLQLKLKATYDQARFDELELFFINRDGGGLKPVKVYDDVIEGKDAEEIYIDDEDTDQKSETVVTRRVDSGSQTEQRQSTEDIQSKFDMERTTLESQLKEAKKEKSTLEERCKELTQKLESTEQSLVSQRIGNSVEREKLQSELKENQKLVKELQDKVKELEHALELSNLKKSGDKGDWSMTLVSGQHQDQGQKFKSPRGLAFHRDKLVVCDTGNNIVQILNKDYTCDKVIGSFDGQFAKPFRPWSVAISRFNHYFILDGENKQIVVCDANGKIIQIITLPENIKVVWDIALMDDFVLVTLRLTSPDTSVRPEDRGDRLVKYTQSGEYLAEVNGQIRGQGQFDGPVSVVVNSNNVIMVYDGGNGCIKCFDSDLNFLHQFGQSQLSGRIVGYYGCIAVDEDDNVYVCDFNDRIVKYRCDGKLICYLLEGNVRYPLYIAVMGDKIGVVELNSDQIKVFSK